MGEAILGEEIVCCRLEVYNSDIVLGFRPKEVRQYTGFGEA